MRINKNNVMFCFAHLQSCHNGWGSNILIVVGKTKHSIVYSLSNPAPHRIIQSIRAQGKVIDGLLHTPLSPTA